MTTFLLVPGFWIGGWAWGEVATSLRTAGHQVHPVTLTGVAEKAHLATPDTNLDTHTDDIVRLIEQEDLRDVVLVGHSGGGMPVTQAADRIPERIRRIVYVESGPLPDGVAQFDTNDPAERDRLRARIGDGHLLPVRDWDAATDPVLLAGLDDAMLATLRERSTPTRWAPRPSRSTAPAPATGCRSRWSRACFRWPRWRRWWHRATRSSPRFGAASSAACRPATGRC
ncbi:hypothetical protein Psuf_063650 [Phytohabitans suffuscus]|uniref:AB hydrolase-1 domain-containing protein n=1 Tax=Phytohabitans suffuscus TaxID=624315 RepID=A0A6F8YSH3_9ACTN|nr:alpha/beta fold hydrolase [Phytohabitans suffuscus]BCB89052.1 hypothetical protein Psuf_063650 [Phytohabitans suffuscus]